MIVDGGLPRRLHQVWVGGSPPSPLDRWIAGWRDLHPEWTHWLWGDDDLDWLEHRDLFDRADEFVPADAVGQMRGDIVRYEILWRYGGVYVDADFEPRLPIDDLCDRSFMVQAPTSGEIANGIIGMPAGHPLMRRAIDGLVESSIANRGRKAMWLTGPRYLSALLRDDDGVDILPSGWFFPYRWDQLDKSYRDDGCYAVHHWLHMRTVRRRSLEG